MRRVGLLLVAMGTTLIVSQLGRAEETAGPHYEHLKPLEPIIGQWRTEGQWQDGVKFVGEESSEWFLNKNAIHSHGWYRDRDDRRVDYHIVTGWDPASRQIVERFTDSNGSHSERQCTYDPTTELLAGQQKGIFANGETFSYDVTIGLAKPSELTWTGTNFQGPEPFPNLEFTFIRVEPATEALYKTWLQYPAGAWTVTDLDGETFDWSAEPASDGAALVAQGKSSDGAPFLNVWGWDPGSKTLVETWHLSNGSYLVNRYNDITEHKLSGVTSLVDLEGKRGQGKISRERISADEMKTIYRGTVPNDPNEVELIWNARRK